MNSFKLTLLAALTLTLCEKGLLFAEPSVQAKVGAFFPFSKNTNRFFHAMPIVGLEGHYVFCGCWDAWLGVEGMFGEGRSPGCGRTSIQIVPFSLGIGRSFCLTPCLEGYLRAGGLWSLYNNHDHCSSVIQHIHSNTFGGIFKAELRYQTSCCFKLSFFTEYLYQRFSFHKPSKKHFTYRHDVDMSGLQIGIGAVYPF